MNIAQDQERFILAAHVEDDTKAQILKLLRETPSTPPVSGTAPVTPVPPVTAPARAAPIPSLAAI